MLLDALDSGFQERGETDARILTEFWPSLVFGAPLKDTWTGEDIDEEKALGLSALWAVVNRIASTISMLPLYLYKRRSDGGREKADSHPVFKLLVRKCNRDMIPSVWKKLIMLQLLLGGNCFLEELTNGRGDPNELIVLPAGHVQWKRVDGFVKYYIWKDGREQTLDSDRLIHLRGLSVNGIDGLSPVTMARQSIALGISLKKFKAKLIANDATPRGLLQSKEVVGKDAKEKLRKEWERIHRGPDRAGRIAILDLGLEYKQLGMSLKDAEFVQSEKFETEEIARWYGIPPHKIGILDKATFSNITEQNIEYLLDCIGPWLKLIEESLTLQLLKPREQGEYFLEFDREDLYNTDIKTMEDAYARRVLSGTATPNEIRAKRNENPIKGGNTLILPSSHVPLEKFLAPDPEPASDSGSDAQGDGDQSGAGSDADPGSGGQEAGFDQLYETRAFEPIVRDVLARAYRRECKHVSKHFKKQARSGTKGSFEQWHREWLHTEHRSYLEEVFAPVAQTFSALSGSDPEKMLKETVEYSLSLSEANVRKLLDPLISLDEAFAVLDSLDEKQTDDVLGVVYAYGEENK